MAELRRSLASLATVLLGLTATACGASNAAHSPSRSSTPGGTAVASTHSSRAVPGGYSKRDGDNDFDDETHYSGTPANDDLGLLASYGPNASPTDARAVTTVVKRYYAASAGGDAATACSLLTASLAGGLPMTDQSRPGQGAGNTCAGSMSQLLAQQRKQLAGEGVPTMAVSAVHVKGNLGLAVLKFKTTPESEIVVEREGRVWKIGALFDSYMP